MAKVAIGICTYRRLDGLSKTIAAVQKLRLPRLNDEDVSIIIVDNNPDISNEYWERLAALNARFSFHYVREPRKGLSNARNAAIAEAIEINASYLAFIDDDEVPSPVWLDALLGRIVEVSSAVAAGPSYPIFERPPGNWLPVDCYAYRPADRKGFARDASSANMMVDIAALSRLGIFFDPRFNETGGEDTQLISRLVAQGEKIAWAEEAVVWDYIPAHRMRATWLFQRWFRTGVTETQLTRDDRATLAGRSLSLGKGLMRILYGSIRIAGSVGHAVVGVPSLLVASCFTFCRGLGYVAGAMGRSFDEYSSRRYR